MDSAARWQPKPKHVSERLVLKESEESVENQLILVNPRDWMLIVKLENLQVKRLGLRISALYHSYIHLAVGL